MTDIPTDVEATSNISAVTVFEHGGQVFRNAKVSIGKGVSRIIFRDLPGSLNRDTLQVTMLATEGLDKYAQVLGVEGTGQALREEVLSRIILKGIAVETLSKPNDQYGPARTKSEEAAREIEKIEAEIQALQDTISLTNTKGTFMDKAWDKAVQETKQPETEDLSDPALWEKLITQRISMKQASAQEVRTTQAEIARLRALQTALNADRTGFLNTSLYIQTEVVTVLLSSPIPVEELEFQLSYLVNEAQWSAAYDVRVDSVHQSILIQYNATVTQWSGEAWPNVQLDLSTAKPHVSSDQPNLSPWRISLYTPVREVELAKSSRSRAMAAPSSAMMLSDAPAAPPAPMRVETATVTEGASSQTFTVKGKHAVSNDRKVLRVTLTQFDLPATFSYVVRPRSAEVAFAQARIENTTELFLLPGPTSIFLDQQFLARSNMGKVAPMETFSVDVGRDDEVVVTRKQLKKVRSEEGGMLSSKKLKYEYEFQTTVENKKAKPITVELTDPFPCSNHGDINVNLLKPEVPEGSHLPDLKVTDEGFVQWKRTIAAGSKFVFPLAFKVTYPEDRSIEGL